MSNLLINEPPLQVLPSLAMAIGLNEAIVLQQLHYLLAFASITHQGKKWVYNSHEEWQAKQFKFWSVATVKRTFASLQKQGLVVCEKLQSKYRNQTNFYTIDYDKLGEIQANLSAQNEPMHRINMSHSIRSNCTDGTAQFEPMSSGQNEPMLQENTNRIHTRENIQESESTPTQPPLADEKTSPNPSVNKPTGKTSSSAKKSTSSVKQKFDPKTYPLEDTVDYELWCDFVDMRKSIKKPLTKYACKLLVKDFKEWIDEGLSPNKALGESIKNSWQGVFKERAVIDVPKSTFANQNNTWQQNPKPNRQSELEALAGAFGDDFYSRNNQSGQSQFYQVPQIGVTNHE